MDQGGSPSAALLYEVLDAAIEITGAQMGNVQLLEDGVLRIIVQRGFHPPFLKFFADVEDGHAAACGNAMRRRRRVVVEDITDSPIFKGSRALGVLLDAGVRAVQSTPIVDRSGTLIGMFSTHFREPHRPDQRELRMLDLLSRQAAQFIERERDRETLATKERELATITENVGSPITKCSRDLRYIFANEAYARLIGRTVEQIVGRPVVDVLGAETFETIRPFVERVLSGERVEYESSINFPGTGERYTHVVYVPDVDADGTVRGWFAGMADITERKNAEEELRRAEEELLTANRHKDEFIAVLGHELRNPLSVLRSGLEVLRGPNRVGKNPETLAMLGRQVDHMVRLVDDLLDLNRVSRGSFELRIQRVDLADLIDRAVEDSWAMLQTMGHELNVTLPSQSIYLYVDAERIVQVVGNLLGNACKFMETSGRIDLSVEKAHELAVIRVRDTGVGLAAEDTGRIFEMFTQVDTSLQRGNGLGIGLTLVKGIVEKHDGTVEARSDGPGRGSEFIVRLPILTAAGPEPAAPEGQPKQTIHREILIVDDDRDNAETLAQLLDASGHKTHIAYDGIKALEAAERLRPDVVLLDIGMPRLSGYDACRRIRSQPWGEEMVLVALTGYGQEKDVRSAKEAGFDHHLVKPVSYPILEKVLATLPPRREIQAAR